MKNKILYFFIVCLNNNLIAQKPIVLWMDATANFKRLSNEDSIAFYFEKCKNIGVTDVVIEVKPITGEVLYKSKIAPQLLTWKGYTRNANFDVLQTSIEQGKKYGLKVHAAINVFSGGHIQFNQGIVYTDTTKKNWASILYTDTGLAEITTFKKKNAVMLNPANEAVQEYELSIIYELISFYPDLYGIVLDRVRYDGIESDFSITSKILFEKYLDKKNIDFPSCIFSYTKEDNKIIKQKGQYYKKWLEWRASIIYGFMLKAKNMVKSIHPQMLLEDYTGAWFPTYYEVGVNWASNTYAVHKKYDWATNQYKKYGYAELVDVYMSGCYFYEVNKAEVQNNNKIVAARNEAGMSQEKALWYSVEGSAELANEVTKGKNVLYASIYVEQYKQNAAQCKRAMQMCLDKSKGLMIFDLVHIVEKDWWFLIKELKK